MKVSKPQTPQPWFLAVAASVVLHLTIAGSLQQGWLSLGGGGNAGTGTTPWGAGDLAIPLNLSDFSLAQPSSDTPTDPQQPAPQEKSEKEPVPAIPPAFASPPPAMAALQTPVNPEENEPPLEPLAQEVELGIDDGAKESMDWLGANRATDHSAMLSSVNQPAWALTPGIPTPLAADASNMSVTSRLTSEQLLAPQQAVMPAAPVAEQTGNQATPQQSPGAAENLQDKAAAAQLAKQAEEKSLAKQDSPAPKIEDDLGQQLPPEKSAEEPKVTPQETEPLVQDVKEADQPPKPAVPIDPSLVAQPTNPVVSTAAQQAADAAAPNASPTTKSNAPTQGGGSTGNRPGEKSDAESIATSTVPSLNFRPGTPLAGEGVRIRTVAPKFSITSRVASRPRNPVLELTFSREGKVVAGKFVEGRTSGYEDIDGPILDAAMRWTATGKKLQELTASDPKATFIVRITYLLQ